ncbi:hypothetical protein ES703_101835 [subsurface metagenome]
MVHVWITRPITKNFVNNRNLIVKFPTKYSESIHANRYTIELHIGKNWHEWHLDVPEHIEELQVS